jgi:hypothetical protein
MKQVIVILIFALLSPDRLASGSLWSRREYGPL